MNKKDVFVASHPSKPGFALRRIEDQTPGPYVVGVTDSPTRWVALFDTGQAMHFANIIAAIDFVQTCENIAMVKVE